MSQLYLGRGADVPVDAVGKEITTGSSIVAYHLLRGIEKVETCNVIWTFLNGTGDQLLKINDHIYVNNKIVVLPEQAASWSKDQLALHLKIIGVNSYGN